jgi:hypothetical protein
MQADVQKRRPVCFSRHFSQCFSRLRTLEFSGCRRHSWQRSDDPPTSSPLLGHKLSAISESLGKRGYTEVAIESGVGNERLDMIFDQRGLVLDPLKVVSPNSSCFHCRTSHKNIGISHSCQQRKWASRDGGNQIRCCNRWPLCQNDRGCRAIR